MAKVAVITRTKDRTLMLERARHSVLSQTFRDFVWVVVNDGGERSGVDAVLRDWPLELEPVVCVHHEVNRGMEAASNAGIHASKSDYIVIHDDDDTWHPRFLEETVGYLDSPDGLPFAAVLTGTTRVDETMTETSVVERHRSPWKPQIGGYPVGCVQFSDLAVENLFAPIALLIRRSAYEAVGGYDETLPVLGDWDFNLRLLCHGDIAVIPEELANYHHRPSVKGSNYGNSVHAGVNRHVIYDAVVRNRIVRKAMNDGNPVLATLVIAGRNRLAMSGGWTKRLGGRLKHVARRLLRAFR